MANNYNSGIWTLDSPSPVPITTGVLQIRAMKWISIGGTLGDQAILQDGFGNPVWQGVCGGADFDTGVFDLGGRRNLRGLTLFRIDSGLIYIYTDAV